MSDLFKCLYCVSEWKFWLYSSETWTYFDNCGVFQPGGNRTGMEDVFMGAVTLGTGPGVISSQPDKYGFDANGFGASIGGGGNYRPRQQQGVNKYLLYRAYPQQ